MREQWGSRWGFILATIGASVGLGNIWRFSYVAGENGGAVFLFIYIICVALVGLPLVIAELSLGRRAQGDAIAAFDVAGNSRRWRLTGWLAIAGAALILSYYAVIAGWALKYFAGAATGALWKTAEAGYGAYFRDFISARGEPVFWQAVMLGASVLIVASGVRRGIEAVNRWLMPVLALIVLGLAGFALTLPGAENGLRFLFAPDWSAFARPGVYVAALGQAFFSLGIGMAIFITFGSYMPRSFSLPSCAIVVAIGDSLFAVAAGLAIFPAVFTFGVDPTAGPELAFITLPQVFLRMPGGSAVGTIFFFLLAAGAFTSMVSLLEVPVSMAVQRIGLERRRAAMLCGAVVFIVGLPSAMSFGTLENVRIDGQQILDAIDHAASNFLLPASGILLAVFVGWRLERSVALHEADMPTGWPGRLWLWLLRTVVPAMIAVILFHSASTL